MIYHTEPGKPILFVSSATSETSGSRSPDAIVEAAYQQVLKRSADAAGLQQYAPQLSAGSITTRDVVRDLMQSDEWAARFVHDCRIEETVLALYDCVLARAPDVEGWNQLLAWEPRNEWRPIIDSMIDGDEYAQRFGSDLVPGTFRTGKGDANLPRNDFNGASQPAAARL